MHNGIADTHGEGGEEWSRFLGKSNETEVWNYPEECMPQTHK